MKLQKFVWIRVINPQTEDAKAIAAVMVTRGFWKWKKRDFIIVCRSLKSRWYYQMSGWAVAPFQIKGLEREWVETHGPIFTK